MTLQTKKEKDFNERRDLIIIIIIIMPLLQLSVVGARRRSSECASTSFVNSSNAKNRGRNGTGVFEGFWGVPGEEISKLR